MGRIQKLDRPWKFSQAGCSIEGGNCLATYVCAFSVPKKCVQCVTANSSIGCSRGDPICAAGRELAALVASKVFYHLEDSAPNGFCC
eukprot:6458288-Amphidinium_carterae.2